VLSFLLCYVLTLQLHESLDADCPGAKSCFQIARSCIDADKNKRPTIDQIIEKLNEMESLRSSIYRVWLFRENMQSCPFLASYVT
jgi:hypothetical protein